MLNFTVGPVQMDDEVREIGAQQIPYFRTAEFSKIMKENEEMMKQLTKAPENARTVFLTGSGTAAMEAAIINLFNETDKLLVINGGSFGARFAAICDTYGIPNKQIKPAMFDQVTDEMLHTYAGQGYTGLAVNICETSTGVLYDMEAISRFCRENKIMLVGDAISAFLADEIDMNRLGIDCMLTGSQKALACPPGVSVLVLSPQALDRIEKKNPKAFYLNLKAALKDAERGQTPFTPAVGTLLQIHARLQALCRNGVEKENKRIAELAAYFRNRIKQLPFSYATKYMSNSVTALTPTSEGVSAYDIFLCLKDEYGIWVCPNGGDLAEKVLRVGHIGALTESDYDQLIDALESMQRKGKL